MIELQFVGGESTILFDCERVTTAATFAKSIVGLNVFTGLRSVRADEVTADAKYLLRGFDEPARIKRVKRLCKAR